MVKVEEWLGDLLVSVQNIRLTFKKRHRPPLLWIERYRPRKGDYEIVLQLTANSELAEALRIIIEQIR